MIVVLYERIFLVLDCHRHLHFEKVQRKEVIDLFFLTYYRVFIQFLVMILLFLIEMVQLIVHKLLEKDQRNLIFMF